MITIDKATTYTIAPGQSNFRPLENPMPRCASGFQLEARFDESCWWPETPENRDDRQDWNKLKGFTHFFGANNRRSVMIAWRPGKLKNVIEVTAYTNDKRGGWKVTGNPVEVYAGQVFSARCDLVGKKAHYVIQSFGLTSAYTHDWDRPSILVFREVGTWIGGSGTAPQSMKLEVDFRILK